MTARLKDLLSNHDSMIQPGSIPISLALYSGGVDSFLSPRLLFLPPQSRKNVDSSTHNVCVALDCVLAVAMCTTGGWLRSTGLKGSGSLLVDVRKTHGRQEKSMRQRKLKLAGVENMLESLHYFPQG